VREKADSSDRTAERGLPILLYIAERVKNEESGTLLNNGEVTRKSRYCKMYITFRPTSSVVIV
jgi:hypothetical protein